MPSRPQQRKPWFHAPSGFWCAQIDGKRHYLDRDPATAQFDYTTFAYVAQNSR